MNNETKYIFLCGEGPGGKVTCEGYPCDLYDMWNGKLVVLDRETISGGYHLVELYNNANPFPCSTYFGKIVEVTGVAKELFGEE